MMKILLFLISCSIAYGQLILDYELPKNIIALLAENSKMTPPLNAAITPCIDPAFNHCQAVFNSEVNVDENLGYQRGTELYQTVNALLDGNTTEILKICSARTKFYKCLGSSYYVCLNLFNIISRNGVDYVNGFDYTRTFMSLEFLCNAGFEEVINQYSCLKNIPTTKLYKNCLSKINETSKPGDLCPNVDEASQCLYGVYNNACASKAAGYYGCENFRTTFDQTCYGLRCNVV